MHPHNTYAKALGKQFLFRLLACLCLLLCPASASANGGPMDINEIARTGNVKLTKAENIRLTEETLEIMLMGDKAQVRVTYTLQNTGPDAEVGLAFPVDIHHKVAEDYPERKPGVEYTIYKDDTPLEFVIKEDGPSPSDLCAAAVSSLMQIFHAPMRFWHVSTLTFSAGQETTVRIEYTAPVLQEDMLFSKSFMPIFSSRIFLYDPSPAAGWGDGRIGKLTIIVDNSDNEALGGKTLNLDPNGFKETSPGVYRLELKDVDPAAMGPVMVEYDIEGLVTARYLSEYSLPSDRVLSLTASSTLEDKVANGPAKIMDRDFNTAWFPKGDGKGEWIEIAYERFYLTGIVVVSGYTKSKELYYANSRPAALNVEFFPNSEEASVRENQVGLRPLEDKNYDLFHPEAFASFAQILSDFGDGHDYGHSGKVRLTITDTYAGTKYKDVGISELYLVGWSLRDEDQ